MDADFAALPDDIDALKAALMIARAKASEDLALIAHQKLRIAKLERQIYGPRSERSSLLIEQLALTFEELEASATEDELAAEIAAAKVTASVSSSIRQQRAIVAVATAFARWARMSPRLWNRSRVNGK
jgi:transposase